MRGNGFLWFLVFLFMIISLLSIFYIFYDKGYLNKFIKIDYLDNVIKAKEETTKDKYDLNKVKINGDNSYMTLKSYQRDYNDNVMYVKLSYDYKVYVCNNDILNCNEIYNVYNVIDIEQYYDNNNYIYYMLTDTNEVYKYILDNNSYMAIKENDLINIKSIDEYTYCSDKDNCYQGILAIDKNNNYIYVNENKIA